MNGITQSAIIEFPGHTTELAAQAFTEDMLLDIESIRELPQIKVRIAAAASLVTDPDQEVRPVLAEHCEDNEMGETDPLCGWISAGDMSNASETIDCPEGSVCQDGICPLRASFHALATLRPALAALGADLGLSAIFSGERNAGILSWIVLRFFERT